MVVHPECEIELRGFETDREIPTSRCQPQQQQLSKTNQRIQSNNN